MNRSYRGIKNRLPDDPTELLRNVLFAIALTAAVISCFSSISSGIIAIVVVILTDLFCYALLTKCSKGSRILLGALVALAWLLLIFA